MSRSDVIDLSSSLMPTTSTTGNISIPAASTTTPTSQRMKSIALTTPAFRLDAVINQLRMTNFSAEAETILRNAGVSEDIYVLFPQQERFENPANLHLPEDDETRCKILFILQLNI